MLYWNSKIEYTFHFHTFWKSSTINMKRKERHVISLLSPGIQLLNYFIYEKRREGQGKDNYNYHMCTSQLYLVTVNFIYVS